MEIEPPRPGLDAAGATRRRSGSVHRACEKLLGDLGRRRGGRFRLIKAGTGQPRLERDGAASPIGVSLAHGGECGLVALAEDGAVGVDVEPLRPIEACDALARATLAPGELDWLSRRPPESRDADFIRLWCLKEAFVKATGEGLARPFDSFEVSLDPLRLVSVDGQTDSARGWSLHLPIPIKGYVFALAIKGSEYRVALE